MSDDTRDDHGKYHTSQYARDRANEEYRLETLAAQERTAINTEEAAIEAAKQTRIALAQAKESKRQTEILEAKASLERDISFLEGESAESKWKYISSKVGDEIKNQISRAALEKIQNAWTTNASKPSIAAVRSFRNSILAGENAEAEIEKLKAQSKSLTKAKAYSRFLSKRKNLYLSIAGYFITVFILHRLSGATERSNMVPRLLFNAWFAMWIVGLTGWPLLIIHKNQVGKDKNLIDNTERIKKLEKDIAQEEKNTANAFGIIEIKPFVANSALWKLEPTECFDIIWNIVDEWQSNLPGRCHIKSEEIPLNSIQSKMLKDVYDDFTEYPVTFLT